jgi:ankyrin repeat protein
MFDPKESHPHALDLLEICASEEFSLWDIADNVGWTIVHRAAAFGQGRDVQKLVRLGASTNIEAHNLRWLPLHCAVKFGNLSTFEALASSIDPSTLASLRDSRGWTLLHLAAESGCEALILKLLRLGLDPREKSDASTRDVPEGLKALELLPMDIARSYGKGQAFESALNSAAASTILLPSG